MSKVSLENLLKEPEMYRILCAILVAIIITYAFNHDSHNTKPVAPTKVEIIFTGKTPAYMAPAHAFDQEQLECLAKNIYFEARGESVQGQVAVSHVVLNRVKSKRFPNTICGVVKQGVASSWYLEHHNKVVPARHMCQFSWYCDGKPDHPINVDAWVRSVKIASDVMRGIHSDITGGAMWYHADYVSPNWCDDFQHVRSIDTHRFYKEMS